MSRLKVTPMFYNPLNSLNHTNRPLFKIDDGMKKGLIENIQNYIISNNLQLMKSVPYVCEKPCGHADDHVGGCGGRLSPRHFQLGKNLLLLLSLGGRDLFILINLNSYHILLNSLVN